MKIFYTNRVTVQKFLKYIACKRVKKLDSSPFPRFLHSFPQRTPKLSGPPSAPFPVFLGL